MQRTIRTLLVLIGISHAQDAPIKDRDAILAMAGTYVVHFHFHETAAIAPGYQLKKKPYEEHAMEIIQVVENTPRRITLQNLLIVTGKDGESAVIKHWAQVWTWQDTHILEYTGSEDQHEWNKITLSKEMAENTWSQLVTSTDDTPRYEGYGKWVHENGQSYWSSSPTRRPLPRREYSKRDDYDYILAVNRHSITPRGWVHEQDNRKVVHRKGEPVQTLCHEFGINTYERSDGKQSENAAAWWKENGTFWNQVRNFWIDSAEKSQSHFSYNTFEADEALTQRISRLEKEKPSAQTLQQALLPYVIIK
jgi:hypothetical protein